MPDEMPAEDHLDRGLEAYAGLLQRSATPPPAAEIRRRAAHRRRNRAAGLAFAAVLVAALGLGTAFHRSPNPQPRPAGPLPVSSSPEPTSFPSYRPGTALSDVSQLGELGIDIEKDVIIDVADDGQDRWLQTGAGDVADFTGTAKDDSTRMQLRRAATRVPNLVTINPSARPGWCVTDTEGTVLALQQCVSGTEAQLWEVVAAGDSGQFNLRGQYGILTIDQRLVPEDQGGAWTGLQTIPFDR
ncbi:hypothetical protein [Actinoplanes sp. TFC3]|uniref:hypothetical protein n=1 Tax=Actinoplanes sp. TFC3 TaxID=1710355 RepID=UPI0008305D5C|nr:hypothetical protein [Actinoplanes sp. TFC3]